MQTITYINTLSEGEHSLSFTCIIYKQQLSWGVTILLSEYKTSPLSNDTCLRSIHGEMANFNPL